ncbi:PhoPQ-activated protein PqaA family protein [Verrucomicrobia bacterium]|nr:PhoPQ-activated protein PqaA family protein [Verrucomicrobiota bacterium]
MKFVIHLILLCVCSAPVQSDVWDMARLEKAPDYRWLDDGGPIRSVIYTGEEFDGKATEVFAFYASPATFNGEKDGKLDEYPGVVLIHGGGGTAFAEWVELWARRGYAAIAMDLSGRRPEAPVFDKGKFIPKAGKLSRQRLKLGGPDHTHKEKFDSIGDSIDTHWTYHAVANVVLAHSLLRSFPDVDAERTAVTGISWGGYTTCITASVDSRFKAAVPVYGCGFLYEGESVQKPSIDKLEPVLWKKWVERYDPSSHLGKCTVPIFFVNGTNDKHYPLDSYMRSYALPRGKKNLRIEPMMRHGHSPGWEPKEIGLFIDTYCVGGKGIPKIGSPDSLKGVWSLPFSASTKVVKAEQHYAVGEGLLVKRKWLNVPAKIEGKRIVCQSPPAKATAWFVTLVDKRGAMVSSEVYFTELE